MSFRVSIAQQPLVWQDAAANRAHFARVLAPLAGTTDLVVLPEMFSTGFTMKPEDRRKPPTVRPALGCRSRPWPSTPAVSGSVMTTGGSTTAS